MENSKRFLVGAILGCAFLTGSGSAQTASMAPPDPAKAANSGRSQVISYLDNIAGRYTSQRRAVVAAIHTRAQAEARQAAVRQGIQRLIGRFPERTPLNAKVVGSTQAEGFHVEKILFESQPGFPVTALLYLPDARPSTQKLPAIVISPGHGPAGKAGDYRSAVMFARSGFVVLTYDPIGQGERLQYPDPNKPDTSLATRPTGEHAEAAVQPTLLGDTVARYMLWDAMRAVDYLTQRPEVDAKRIGAFGCSGGGTMTALLGAMDRRIAAIGVGCYITSFDALLPTVGPQDGEQSIPRFIASGFDFPDWIEVAAPRPYAVISTYSDMFPFAGTRTTVSEARRFYSLFDPASAGVKRRRAGRAPTLSLQRERQGWGTQPPVPDEPSLNSDTANRIPPAARLQFIAGPGGHGALGPIFGDILQFFARNLKPGAAYDPKPVLAAATPQLPKEAFQVTPTGQVVTSYPKSETIFSLNRKRAAVLIGTRLPVSAKELPIVLEAALRTSAPASRKRTAGELTATSGEVVIHSEKGIDLHGLLATPKGKGPHPAVILLVPGSVDEDNATARANKAQMERLVAAGHLVLAITPRPSPAGSEAMKSPILGPFYMLGLRSQLVNRTILGMRVDDVRRITDYLAARRDVNARKITAYGSGHMGLVLLHAAALDQRLRQVTVDHVLPSYKSVIETPMPEDVAEDMVPGVLLRYDIPDILKVLGARAVVAGS